MPGRPHPAWSLPARRILEAREGGRHGRRAERADLPERVERLPARVARLLEARRAHGADEVGGIDLRAAHWAAVVELAETLLHRLDLELALVDVLQVLGGPKEEVDDGAEERRDEPEQRRQPDEPRLLDAATCVLERPEREIGRAHV